MGTCQVYDLGVAKQPETFRIKQEGQNLRQITLDLRNSAACAAAGNRDIQPAAQRSGTMFRESV
jgi:hypothetical protein